METTRIVDDLTGFARERTAADAAREAAYFARVDAAEAFAAYIERMAELEGDEPVDERVVAACDTARHDAPYDYDPEPPTPAAPNVVPFRPRRFDRAAHCQAIAAANSATDAGSTPSTPLMARITRNDGDDRPLSIM